MPGFDWRVITALFVLATASPTAGCREAEPEPSAPPEASRASDTADSEAPIDAAMIEQLNAIGYVAGSTPAGDSKGVITHEPERTQPGINFVVSAHRPGAVLMDMDGNILHEWQAEFLDLFPSQQKSPPYTHNFWRHAELLPNGDVVGIWHHFGIFRLDRNSKILWAHEEYAHHDLFVTEAGEIYYLRAIIRPFAELGGKKGLEDFIVVRDLAGRELRKLSMATALAPIEWPRLRQELIRRSNARNYGLGRNAWRDPFHTNAIWMLSEQEASALGEPFRPGNLLVSMCLLDTIAVIDMEEETARWWQTGPFGLQHQPRVTPDGKIAVFNNFQTFESSTVQIFDPKAAEMTWEYQGPESDRLHSRTSGGVDVLPNGNVLILESNKGRILEVTPDKRVVWQYYNPNRAGDDNELVAEIYTVDRIDASSLDWLER